MTALNRQVAVLGEYSATAHNGNGQTVPGVPATGATAGIPGSWTPAGAVPPSSPAALQAGTPNAVTASPATGWTSGQYVQTGTAGAAGRATWTGTGWVGGAAPLAAKEEEPAKASKPDPEPADKRSSRK